MLRTILIFCCTLGAIFAHAQDLGDTILPKPKDTRLPVMTDQETNGTVTVREGQTKPMADYQVACGQSCSFEAAQEGMAVLGYYFQHIKQSSKLVADDGSGKRNAYQENVLLCVRDNACNGQDDVSKHRQQMFLESSLHYAVGKFIRDAYLENSSNREDLRTIGYDKDTPAKEEMENMDKKWFKAESTWASIKGKIDVNIQEFRPRDNFQFNLNDFNDDQQKKLAELDPEFIKQYQAFFGKYSEFSDRAFAVARRVESPGRALASSNADDIYVQEGGPDGKIKLQEGIRQEVIRGQNEGHEALNAAAKTAGQVVIDPADGKQHTTSNTPQLFSDDDNYIKAKLGQVNQALQIAGGQFKDPTTQQPISWPPQDPNYLAGLRNLGLNPIPPDGATAIRELLAIQTKLQDADKKGRGTRQIAIDVNAQVDRIVQERKQAANDGTKSVNIELDIADFDNFVESIWPTQEGDRYRQQLQAQIRARPSNGTKLSTSNDPSQSGGMR